MVPRRHSSVLTVAESYLLVERLGRQRALGGVALG
jgi:hypothetical protein